MTQLYNRIILIWRQCNREKIILTLVKLTNTYKKVKRIQIYIPLVGSWSPPVVPEKMKNHIVNQFHEISSWVSLQQLFIKTFRRHTKYAYLNHLTDNIFICKLIFNTKTTFKESTTKNNFDNDIIWHVYYANKTKSFT